VGKRLHVQDDPGDLPAKALAAIDAGENAEAAMLRARRIGGARSA